MGWFARLGFAVSAAIATCAGGPAPDTDVERVSRIAEMYQGYQTEFPEVRSLTASEVITAQRSGTELVLVDTRTKGERAVSIIPGAIPSTTVEADLESYRGKILVAYCTIGYRSGLWAQKMGAKGLSVRNLEGSLLSWTHAGGTLQTPAGTPTKRLHVYGRPWDLAHTTYEATW